MKVLFVASEVAPWVKTGGLGDVAAALPAALAQAGAQVRVLMPAYPAALAAFPGRERLADVASPGGKLPGYTLWAVELSPDLGLILLEAPECFGREGNPYLGPDGRDWPDNALRFGLLGRVAAMLAAPGSPVEWVPDVLHCNDWQSALAPVYLRFVHGGAGAASVITVHNLAFQGVFDAPVREALALPEAAFSSEGVEFYQRLSFLKGGLQCCDLITTVSPTYAHEILSSEFGCGLEGLLKHRAASLMGILNGVDTAIWDPSQDAALVSNYDADSLERKVPNKRALQEQLGLEPQPERMLFGVVGRLTEQKGLDLLLEIGGALCDAGAQIALLGTGDTKLEQGWHALAQKHPGACAATIGFDETLAHRIEAGADAFAMPSRFEPCGLNQMYSLRYGTPPIVRRTGGLADTVVDATPQAMADGSANGFVFEEASADALHATMRRAMAAYQDAPSWQALQRTGMRTDFSWSRAAKRYLAAYRAAQRSREG